MEGWAKWFVDLAWPVVSRVLTALGFGTVTYTGADAAFSSVLDSARAAVGGLTSATVQILAMGGMFDYMSITAGGIVSSLTWMVLKRFALQSGTSS